MRLRTLPVLAAALLTGCSAPFLHPVAAPGSEVSDEGLAGEWTTSGATVVRATIAEGAPYTVALTVHHEGEFKSALSMDLTLTRIGGATYADLFLAKSEREKLAGQYGFLALPVHQVAKVQRTGDELRASFFDGDWLEREAAGAGVGSERLPVAGGQVAVVVGSTSQLRAFLAEHADDPGAFAEPMVFHRVR